MTTTTVIKVLGLGGGGSNAINRMIQLGIEGVEFIAANTDSQALAMCEAPTKLLLGPRSARGLGAGGQPSRGEEAAEESAAAMADALAGADMIFLAAGMGGGTGTGAMPVAARVARETGAVTVGVVTLPFSFEGQKRLLHAQAGLTKLQGQCHTLIAVPNDKLLTILPRHVTFDVALRVADEVLRQGIQGMAELVLRSGLINVDFANVRSLMQIPGGAFLAIGQGRGSNKAVDAVNESLHHRLVEADTLSDAAGVLVHFTGGEDLTLHEIGQAMELVGKSVRPEAQIVMGATLDESMVGRAQVIMVATGIGASDRKLNDAAPAAEPADSARDAEMKAEAHPPAEAELAGSLFAALRPPDSRPLEWVVTDEPTAPRSPDNLDIPAFMRRRRLFAPR